MPAPTCGPSRTSPLRDGDAFGLLALASEDAQRFYPEMGTLYLKRLGELVAAAIAHHAS